MPLGIKIRSPYPFSLEGAGMPSAYVSLKEFYIECKITPSDQAQCKIQKHKDQKSTASFLHSKLMDQIHLNTHELTVNIKNAGQQTEKLFSAVIAIVQHANHFFERKGHPLPFQIQDYTILPPSLFHAGKLSVCLDQSVRHLPYPSGLCYAFFRSKQSFSEVPALDRNAFILSEAFFRMDYNALRMIAIPNSIQGSLDNNEDQYLCLLPIVETQSILAVFSNSAEQESFIRRNENVYICSPHLDLDGIKVI